MTQSNLKKLFIPVGLLFIYFVFIKKCSFHPLPKERLSPFELKMEQSYDKGKYQLTLKNPIACHLRFVLSCPDKEVDEILKDISPILLQAQTDTSINIKNKGDLKGKINIKVKWGDPALPIQTNKLEHLPFPKGKKYKLLQGNNMNPTHNSNLSRYAFDFTLEIGDTICSTQNGFVVGVIEGYKGWGRSDQWKSFGNQVMVYDTTTHLFTMYGHLKHNGSLVEVGDYVKKGQPIALSGKTGQTTEEHLHFNVWRADSRKNGLLSYQLDSIGNYKVKELQRHQWMEH